MEESKQIEMTLQEFIEKTINHQSPSEMNKRLNDLVQVAQDAVDKRNKLGLNTSELVGAIKFVSLADGYEKYLQLALSDVKVNGKSVDVNIDYSSDEILLSW